MTTAPPSTPLTHVGPTFTIHPCTPSDLPSMQKIYTHSFENDAFRLARWPASTVPPSTFNPWITNVFAKYLRTPHTMTWKVVENSTGNIAGWTHWSPAHEVSVEEEESQKKEEEREEREREEKGEEKFPVGSVVEICEAKVEGWKGLRERWYRRGDMYLIYVLTISPTYQKLGLGTYLLNSILSLADSQSKSCYLEATAAGYPIYERVGFKTVEVMEVDTAGHLYRERLETILTQPFT